MGRRSLQKLGDSKDKFYHVIDKDQLELFSKNIQDVLVGSLLGKI